MDLKILKIASNTENNKILDNFTHRSKNKNLKEVEKFVTSCENIFENTKTVIEKSWKGFVELFDKKNISRKECLLLPLRTVLKALKI